MIDHLLGRPSTSWRKTQVLGTALFWLVYLRKTDPNGPPLVRRFSTKLARVLTPWQLLLIISNIVYVVKHLDAIVGLAAPEPLAHMYSANFYRATWLLTALDAGFWTAMPIRPNWIRHVASLLFSIYYLIFANQAEEKVRKIRATITVEQLRLSWEKVDSPVIRTVSNLLRPRVAIVKKIQIRRGDDLAPVDAWLYFDGTAEELAEQEKIVISFPGGGFVSMSPREHDDAHLSWAKKLGVPFLSIDYKKAPEHVYPYAVYECFDAYREVMVSKGAALNMGLTKLRKSALVGDSAGGNYVAAVMLMLLENQSTPQITLPSGLVLIYPFLDFNITSWMSAEHLRLLRQESANDLGVLSSKRHHERRKSVLQVYPDNESQSLKLSELKSQAQASVNNDHKRAARKGHSRSASADRNHERPLGTRVAMTSRVSFFQDRIISPDMMRAMALLYIGPHSKPDFQTDYLLSPILAPSDLLAKFPKTYFICGEVDPFVDDTVIMAGRIREAKQAASQRRRDLAMSTPRKTRKGASGNEDVEMTLVRGTSHGFLQMRAILPEARNSIARCRSWMQEILEDEVPVKTRSRRPVSHLDLASTKASFTAGEESEDDGGPQTSGSAAGATTGPRQTATATATNPKTTTSRGRDEPTTPGEEIEAVDINPLTGLKRGMTHDQWENKHLMTQDELLSNRKTAITRSIVGNMLD